MSDFSKGFHDAASLEPFDETMSAGWQHGWNLWHQRGHYQRQWAKHPQQSYASH